MASRKRLAYVSDFDDEVTQTEDSDQEYYPAAKHSHSNSNQQQVKKHRNPTRVPTSFSRNALMARENRQKKKHYLETLEKDVDRFKNQNEKLHSIMRNQSFVITELRKEVEYMKAVLANSSDITKLMKTVHQNTGMSVSSSLSHSLAIKTDCISKKSSVSGKTAHSWGKQQQPQQETTTYPSYPTPESMDDLPVSMNDFDLLDSLTTLSDNELLDFPLTDNFPLELDDNIPIFNDDEPKHKKQFEPLTEHNYTTKQTDSNLGICLHISNNRVSLEFCSSCCENATTTWNQTKEDF